MVGRIRRYLNALVMFATIFKTSPIGANYPNGQLINGYPLPDATIHGVLSAADASALQRVAHAVVLGDEGERHALWSRQSHS